MRSPEQQIAVAETLVDLVRVLEALFDQGYNVDEQGRLYTIFVEVAQLKGLKIEIRHREHPPPHFHVLGADVDASFAVVSGDFLEGRINSRHKRLIRWWHRHARNKLIDTWNRTRPSDCGVGPIDRDA